MKQLTAILLCLLAAVGAEAQSSGTTFDINPTLTYLTSDGEETVTEVSASAPLTATFKANPTGDSGLNVTYEWRFYTEGNRESPYLVRYQQDTEFTFLQAGSHLVVLYATYMNAGRVDTLSNEDAPLRVIISESRLEFPNAFSPNGDGINDVYKAKEGYQSITEFHAYIYNRWGQMLFDWTDPAGGWDGTYKGKPVKQGVYFVLVKARGADGRVFNIKRDVNLLRGYTEGTSTSADY